MNRNNYPTIKVNDFVEIPSTRKPLIKNALTSTNQVRSGVVTKVWEDNTFLIRAGYLTYKVAPTKRFFGLKTSIKIWLNGRLVEHKFITRRQRKFSLNLLNR